MMPVDPWSVLAALIQLAAVGFSPLCVPLVVFINFGFRQEWWTQLHAAGHTEWEATSIWLPAIAIVTYWLNGGMLLLVDRFVRPDVLQQFKIQADKSFDQQKLCKVCKNILVGQFFVIVPYAYACALLGKYTPLGVQFPAELPSGRRMFVETLLFILFDELVFFYSHWALHSKIFGVNLYTWIHKIHHEFTAPIGLVASYCHPIEMLVSNALPLTFGAAVFKAHAYSIMVWTMFAVLGTQFHHCGYRWSWVSPLDHNPDFHDFHHQKFTCNYGLLGWLDLLHGTSKPFLEHQQKLGKKKVHPVGGAISGGMAVALLGSILTQLTSA